MGRAGGLLPVLALAGCLDDLLPGPPVLDATARAAYDLREAAPVSYTGAPRVEFPILPVQVWGLRYALDLVVVTEHPAWTMHEYARIDLPAGSFWVAKDADAQGRQTITADLPDLAGWVPEIPAPRHAGALRVEDRSTADRIDLQLAYPNPAGERVEVRWQGPMPTAPSRPRNGNTMGHSRDVVAALLDLHLFRAGGAVELRFDGQLRPVKRLFGVYPMVFALAQTQGGFAIADFRQFAAEGGFELVRPGDPAVDWPTHGREAWRVADGWARHDGPVTTQAYHYTEGELDYAEVRQAGMEPPAFAVAFQPAIPDLRRPFPETAVSRFAADVGGQPGHGMGTVRTRWLDPDTARVEVRPEAPPWFADRPIDVTIRYEADGVRVRAERVTVPSGG